MVLFIRHRQGLRKASGLAAATRRPGPAPGQGCSHTLEDVVRGRTTYAESGSRDHYRACSSKLIRRVQTAQRLKTSQRWKAGLFRPA